MRKQRQAANYAIPDVVADLLRDDVCPEAQEAYERLTGQGYSDKETRRLIGQVLAREYFEILTNGESFDRKRFADRLNKLPEKPFG